MSITDALRLMVRDAHSLFMYWEVSHRKRWLVSQHFQCDWDEMPKALRLYDVTCIEFHGSNANSQFDVRLTPEASSWYVEQLKPNTTYLADYGTYSLEQQFIPLLRSNPAHTPRDQKAIWGEPLASKLSETYMQEQQRISPHYFENFKPILHA